MMAVIQAVNPWLAMGIAAAMALLALALDYVMSGRRFTQRNLEPQCPEEHTEHSAQSAASSSPDVAMPSADPVTIESWLGRAASNEALLQVSSPELGINRQARRSA